MCKLIQEQGIIMVSFLQPDAGAWMVCLLIAVHKFDAICFSEINLDSSVAPDDNNLDISGYNLVQPGHRSNNKCQLYYTSFCHCEFSTFNTYMNV